MRDSRSLYKENLASFLAAIILLLTAASVATVFKGASDEPYGAFRVADAIVQLGVATTLIVAWVWFAGAIILDVMRREIDPPWLLALLWMTTMVFYLLHCPFI